MNTLHVIGRWRLIVVTIALLATVGCQSQPDDAVSPAEFAKNLTIGTLHAEQREQLAADLARLDQICWFMIITRSQSAIASSASIICKAKTGGVTDANVFAQGRTVSEAVAIAIAQLEEQLPSAKLQRGKAEDVEQLKQTISDIEQLAVRSWEIRLDKNNGWTALIKARRADELYSRTVRVDHPTAQFAVREALLQLQKSEAPLRN